MEEPKSTTPKPFVFVLMPFRSEFNDTYKFGIKGAAEEVGAYAERVDEQIFTEGILDRVYNQINKADVIVADMSGQNPNVFYEVGYAHALGKIVVLLTHNADDIPFDLKHRSHIIYSGSIEKLRSALAERLRWAINQAQRQGMQSETNPFKVSLSSIFIPAGTSADTARTVPIKFKQDFVTLPVHIRNISTDIISSVSHLYLFSASNPALKPYGVNQTSVPTFFELTPFLAAMVDSPDRLNVQYRLDNSFSNLPPRAVESFAMAFGLSNTQMQEINVDEVFRLRLHYKASFYDFPFRLKMMSPHRSLQ
ncbi:MAG: nucleoside 2-deoxyribosyltransferase [Pyrinomonadaceae bacterium]